MTAGAPSAGAAPAGATAVGARTSGASAVEPALGQDWEGRESFREVPLYFWCFLAALALNIFSGSWDRLHLPLAPDRLLFPAALVLALLHPGRAQLRWRSVHGFMLAFALLASMSLLFLGTLGPTSVFALVDRIYMPLLLFTTAPLFLRTPTRRRYFVRGLTLVGLYLGITAVAETFEISPLVQPHYILDARHALLADGTGEPPRAGGPMLASEGNGMSNAMCAAVAALCALTDRGWWRALGVLTVPLCLIGAFLSMTRSVWLGAALAVVLVLVLHRRLWRWIPAVLLLGVLALALGAATFPQLAETAQSRGSTSRSVYDRFNTNAAGLRILDERPLTGIGWGEFLQTGTQWVRQSDSYPLTSVNIEIHNVFLSRAAELGIPAAALFVLVVVLGPGVALWGRRAPGPVEQWRALLVAVGVIWLVPCFLSPNPYTFPNFLMWTVAGLVYALPRPGDPSPVLLPPALAAPHPDR